MENKMQGIYGFLRKFNIRNRIALTLLLCILFVTVIIFQVPKFISQNLIKGYLNDYTKSIQKEIETGIELMIDEINMLSVRLTVNENIYDLLDNESLSRGEREEQFRSLLDKSLVHKEVIGDIIVVTHDNGVYRYASDTVSVKAPDEAYISLVQQSSRPVWGSVKKDIHNNGFILIGRKFNNFYTGQDLGCLIIYIRETALEDIYSRVIKEWGTSFIINQDNYIISHSEKEKIGSIISDPNIYYSPKEIENKIIKYDNQPVYLIMHRFDQRLESLGIKWEIVSIISSRKLFAAYDLINRYIVIFQIVMLLIAIYVSFQISSKIIAPVARLKEKLISFGRGASGFLIPEKSGDEIWELERCYNDMIVRINELIQKNNEEKEKQRELELIALQAQINPHFLYNSLDTIGWAAKLKNPNEIERLVMSLANFFRISLHKGEKFIKVSEEIHMINSFVTIEQMGFEEKFDVHYDIDDEIKDCKMLKIVLQPIVENAIKHGISRKKGKGNIYIKGVREGDDLKFEIIDDGVGFDVNSMKFEKAYNNFQHSGYGLRNVNERIILEYGKGYGLSFESNIGTGTKVSVRLKIKI